MATSVSSTSGSTDTVDLNTTIDSKIDQISSDYQTALYDIEQIEVLSQELEAIDQQIKKCYGPCSPTSQEKQQTSSLVFTEEQEALLEEGGMIYIPLNSYCIAIITYNEETGGYNVTYGTTNEKTNKLPGLIDEYNATLGELQACEEDLLMIDGSSEMADLVDSLNQLLLDEAYLVLDSHDSNINEELSDIEEYMNSLMKIMEDQLKIDEDVQIMEECGDEMTVAQAQYYATDLTTVSTREVQDLDKLEKKISDDFVKYRAEYDDAQASYYISEAKMAESYGFNGEEENKKAEQEMKNVSHMLTLMQDLLAGIQGVYASLQPDYIQLSFVFKSIQKEIDEILADTSLSPQEQKTQVLALLIYLLGYVDLTKEIAEKSKAQDQNKMSDATLDVSQINIHSAITNQKVMEKVSKIIDHMKDTQLAMQVVMTSMCVLLAPGVGMGLAMLALGLTDILASQGVIKFDMAEELGKATGSKLGGELLWTAIEMVIAMGGGAFLDLAIEKATATAVTEESTLVLEASQQTIEEMSQGIVQRFIDSGRQLSQQESAQLKARVAEELKSAVQVASKTAGTTAIAKMFEQTFGSLISDLLSGSMRNLAKEASEKAAQRALIEANDVAIQRFVEGGLQETAAELNQKWVRIGYDAVADLSHTERASFTAQMEKHYGWTMAQRATIAAALGLSYNNVMVDFISWCHHASKSKESDQEMMAVEMIQALLPMLIILASSWGNTGSLSGSSGSWQAVAGVLQSMAGGVSAATTLDLAKIHRSQSDQVKRAKENTMLTEVMNSLMGEMQKYFDQDLAMMISDIASSSRLTSSLSKKSSDAEVEGARILAAAV